MTDSDQITRVSDITEALSKEEERVFTSEEIADILRIPQDTIITWIRSNFISGVINGNVATIPLSSFIKWLKKFSQINDLANSDKRIHWINRNLIEKIYFIRLQKGLDL